MKHFAAYMKVSMLTVLALAFALAVAAPAEAQQRKLIRIFVSTPDVEYKEFQPVSAVVAESIIRELRRQGGMEIIERASAERTLREQGLKGYVNSRESALDAGRKIAADIVIFSTIRNNYDMFNYTVAFLEVDRNVVQRTIIGNFRISASPAEIERKMKEETAVLAKFIPLPSEIGNFGATISEKTIDYDKLPASAMIEGIPQVGRYGFFEQVLSYYRTFPGEEELDMLQQQQFVMRMQTRQEMDQDLTNTLNKFYMYGDFALRHNLQAFLVKDCSQRVFNVLLANGIPVFFTDGIIVGYEGLSPDGFCMYKTIEGQYVETLDLTHRMRMAVMFVVPKPGRVKGISRSYLEQAVGHYRDEWGKTPTLVEIKDSMFDIIASGLE